MSALKREIPCKNYICKGQCELGRNATHSKHCQICDAYKPRSKKAQNRGNNNNHSRSKRLAELRFKERIDEYNRD